LKLRYTTEPRSKVVGETLLVTQGRARRDQFLFPIPYLFILKVIEGLGQKYHSGN